jgi:hypothetical protein
LELELVKLGYEEEYVDAYGTAVANGAIEVAGTNVFAGATVGCA